MRVLLGEGYTTRCVCARCVWSEFRIRSEWMHAKQMSHLCPRLQSTGWRPYAYYDGERIVEAVKRKVEEGCLSPVNSWAPQCWCLQKPFYEYLEQ